MTSHPSIRNPGAAKVCRNEILKDQHAKARTKIMALMNADAIRDRYPVCECREPRGTGRFYGLAARVRVLRLEACLLCDLLIRLGRPRRACAG